MSFYETAEICNEKNKADGSCEIYNLRFTIDRFGEIAKIFKINIRRSYEIWRNKWKLCKYI